MRPAAVERVPAPLRRITTFVVAAVVVYALLLVVGTVLFPAVASGPAYATSSTLAAAIAAFYLVYLQGFGRIRDLLG